MGSLRKLTAMRRLLLLLSLIFAFFVCQGQYAGIVAGSNESEFCAEWQAVLDKMDIEPGRDGDDTSMMFNEFIEGCITDDTWDSILAFWVPAARTEAGAYLNFKDPTGDDNLTNGGSATWTQYTGFDGNGSDMVVGTNLTPSSEGGSIYTLDNSGVCVYTLEDLSETTTAIGTGGTHMAMIRPKTETGNLSTRINTNGTASTGAVTAGNGFTSIARLGATLTRVYKNGAEHSTSATASTSLPTTQFTLLENGTAGENSNNTVAAAGVTMGLSAAKQALLFTRIEKLMDDLGIGVVAP